MKMKIWLLVSGIIIGLLQPGLASMSSPNYSIKTSVMSSGGGPMTSTVFKTDSTLAQPVISEPLISLGYDLYSGFWYTMSTTGCIWDLEPDTGDGDVDGLDIFRFIDQAHEASLIQDFAFEFGRTDCF